SERNIVRAAVRQRNQRRQIGAHRSRNKSGTLICGEHWTVLQDALVLPQALIAEEEKGVVAVDRAANSDTEIVALQRKLCTRTEGQRSAGCGVYGAVEVVASVQRFVAEVIEHLTMELVRARSRGYGHNRAVAAPVFGAEGLVVDLELARRADRRLERDLILADVIQVDAVDLEVHRVFAIARRDKRVRTQAAARRREAAIRWCHHTSRRQHRQIQEVPPVQRKLLNLPLI